jgi:hypothetical protein
MRRHKVDLLQIRKSKDKLKELLKVANLEYETLLGERAAVYGKNDVVVADYLDYRYGWVCTFHFDTHTLFTHCNSIVIMGCDITELINST